MELILIILFIIGVSLFKLVRDENSTEKNTSWAALGFLVSLVITIGGVVSDWMDYQAPRRPSMSSSMLTLQAEAQYYLTLYPSYSLSRPLSMTSLPTFNPAQSRSQRNFSQTSPMGAMITPRVTSSPVPTAVAVMRQSFSPVPTHRPSETSTPRPTSTPLPSETYLPIVPRSQRTDTPTPTHVPVQPRSQRTNTPTPTYVPVEARSQRSTIGLIPTVDSSIRMLVRNAEMIRRYSSDEEVVLGYEGRTDEIWTLRILPPRTGEAPTVRVFSVDGDYVERFDPEDRSRFELCGYPITQDGMYLFIFTASTRGNYTIQFERGDTC